MVDGGSPGEMDLRRGVVCHTAIASPLRKSAIAGATSSGDVATRPWSPSSIKSISLRLNAGLESSARLPGDDPVRATVDDEGRHADGVQPRVEVRALDVPKAVNQMLRLELHRLVQSNRPAFLGTTLRVDQRKELAKGFVAVTVKPDDQGTHRHARQLVTIRGRRIERRARADEN